jgi:hypothetical protein
MMAYPCFSPLARAKRVKKTTGVSGGSSVLDIDQL